MVSGSSPTGSGSTWRLWFSPALLGLHLLLIVSVIGCVAGGLWQWNSYEQAQSKERLERAQLAPVPLESLWQAGEPFTTDLDFRRVRVTGRFAPASEQFWVSGRTQDGKAGFWLMAPLIVAGGDHSLLIARGFSAKAGQLPPVAAGPVRVDGVLRPSEGEGSPLNDQRITGSVRVPALLNELRTPLYEGFAVALTDTGAGLELVDEPEPEVPRSVGLTNLAYALQWWVFAAFAIFMWWRMCRDYVADHASRPDAQDPKPGTAPG